MPTKDALKGLRILVTRPAHQAGRLCALITAAGGYPIALPMLEIAPPRDAAAALTLIGQLAEFDIVIFISPNAAERGLALIEEHGGLPSHVQVAAVGRRTADALEQLGITVDITAPSPYNSEALLATPGLQAVQERRIMIFRGEGGRELLADTLRERGAEVVYAEVYRRAAPADGLAQRLASVTDIDFIVITSKEGLRNLIDLTAAGLRDRLFKTQLVALSQRIADAACEMGFHLPTLVAEEASDEAVVAAMATGKKATLD